MSESKDDSDVELSQETRKVSFADPPPSSPLPASNPAAAAAAAASPPSSAEKGWPDQEAVGLDPSTLTPLAPVVMHRQATINIGTIGHVAHGKSTVVKAISGVQVRQRSAAAVTQALRCSCLALGLPHSVLLLSLLCLAADGPLQD